MKKISHHIKKLRQQPEDVRKHILNITIAVCAIILILLWIFSLGNNM